MPKIPMGQETVRMTPASPVSIADTNDARMVGNAITKLGTAVGDYGTTLGRIENVERDMKAQERKNILDAEGAAALEEAKRSGEKDIPKAFQRIYQERTSKILDNDKDAKEDPILYSRMTEAADHISQVGQIHAQTEMLRAGEERVLNAFKETTGSYRKAVSQTPEAAVSMYKDFKINVLDKAADVAGVSAVRRSDMEFAARSDFAESTVDGYMSQKKFGKALRLLNAQTTGTVEVNGMQVPIEMKDSSGKALTPEEVSFMSALTPEKRDQLVNRIRVAGETENTMKIGYINGRMQDIRQSIMNGVMPNPKDVQDVYGYIASTHLSVAEKAIQIDTFKNLVNTADSAAKMKNATPDRMRKILEDARKDSLRGKPGDPAFNMERRQQDFDLLEKAYKQEIDRRGKDGASAALDAAPDLQQLRAQAADGNPQATQNYVHRSVEVQKMLGIASPKVVTNDEAEEIKQKIVASSSPEMLAQSISEVRNRYGIYAQDVLSQAVKEHDEYKMLSYIGDPRQAAKVAENILNKPQLEAQLKSKTPDDAKSIRGMAAAAAQVAVLPYEQSLVKAYQDGSAGGLIASMANQAEAEYMKKRLSGSSSADAINSAQKVLTDNFNFINSGSGAVVFPKSIRGETIDKDKVKSFMEHAVTAEGLDKLGVKTGANLTPEQRKVQLDKFSSMSKWVPTPELDGLVLTIDGGMAKDANDKPLVVPFKDVEKRMKEMNIKSGWFN